jgi:hypothetical protein
VRVIVRLSARVLARSIALGVIAAPAISGISAANIVVNEVKPSEADHRISRFDDPNLVIFDTECTSDARLVVFLPGTRGRPKNVERLLKVVASQGYLVIGLTYDNVPAVVQVCSRNPAPTCSGAFRERRVFGTNATKVVDNPPEESIVNRLTRLLAYLDAHDPSRRWNSYLGESGPKWDRVVVSGLSQGAGMAAFIAKREPVARVVLFSSPWDFHGPSRTPAPWLFETSETSPDRWFAEYHRRENTAALIANAYVALRIPQDHIRVFDLDVPAENKEDRENPYHTSTTRNPGYVDQWKFLFGHSP